MNKKLTKAEERVLEYFFKFPTKEIHVRKLAREIDVSYSSVQKALKELYDMKLIDRREESKMTFYSAKFKSEKFRMEKKVYNLRSLYESGLVGELEESTKPDTLVLFGSFLEGTDREDSDIDIAVVGGRDVEIDLTQFENALERKIQIVKLNNLQEENKEFKNTLSNGYVLSGYLEVVK